MTMTTAALALPGAAAATALAAHVPAFGPSLRDRLRTRPPAPDVGLRVHPARANATLPAAALLELAAHCPVPLDAVSLHVTGAGPGACGGEYAHRYLSAAGALGAPHAAWGVLLAAFGAHAPDRTAALGFLRHRLACLGLRSRVLTAEEAADAARHPAAVHLARPKRPAGLRRPLTWVGGTADWDVPPAPAHVLGTSSGGAPVALAAPATPRVTVAGSTEDATAVIGPAQVLGVRVGIVTARPHRFQVLRKRGAVVITASGRTIAQELADVSATTDPTAPVAGVDALIRDGDHPIPAGYAEVPRITLARHAPEPDAVTGPVLSLGRHAWLLAEEGRPRVTIRPLPMV